MTQSRLPVTAIVLTHNEAVNIERCLAAMQRIEDIAIVDSGSDDNTLEIARRVRPDVRVFSHPFRDFGDQRNWALDHIQPKHEWILFVDADEYCTPELLDEIAALVAAPGQFVGAFIAGKTYFLGRWLRRSTLFPSYQLRLLRRGAVRFRKEGHGQREIADGPLAYLRHAWLHNAFAKGLDEWIARHNRYSSEEIELIVRLRAEPLQLREVFAADPIRRRRALKRLAARAPFRPATRFLYLYLWRRGFLDGWPGLVFCLLRYAHEVHILAKLAERQYRAARPGTQGELALPHPAGDDSTMPVKSR
jgi:glycosyltransferase involved in cell wall biosynthesis